jgi:hypothetical protein
MNVLEIEQKLNWPSAVVDALRVGPYAINLTFAGPSGHYKSWGYHDVIG